MPQSIILWEFSAAQKDLFISTKTGQLEWKFIHEFMNTQRVWLLYKKKLSCTLNTTPREISDESVYNWKLSKFSTDTKTRDFSSTRLSWKSPIDEWTGNTDSVLAIFFVTVDLTLSRTKICQSVFQEIRIV